MGLWLSRAYLGSYYAKSNAKSRDDRDGGVHCTQHSDNERFVEKLQLIPNFPLSGPFSYPVIEDVGRNCCNGCLVLQEVTKPTRPGAGLFPRVNESKGTLQAVSVVEVSNRTIVLFTSSMYPSTGRHLHNTNTQLLP